MFSCIEANRPTTETAGGNNTDGDVGTAACSVPQRTKTLTIKRIVVPIDWSESANCAFRFAESLARSYGAEIDVLHVAPIAAVMYGPPSADYYDRLMQELKSSKASDPKVVVRHLLSEGDPATCILATASHVHCDLIVLGTHGRAGLNRLVMGSVAEKVLRNADCPVVTVKCGMCPPTALEIPSACIPQPIDHGTTLADCRA
jgi:nucleotide-binding universal stress UspA family protein